MRAFATIAVAAAAAVSTVAASASPISPFAADVSAAGHHGLHCDSHALSCPTPDYNATNTCCQPFYGIVAFAQQWVPTLGPRQHFTIHGLWPDKCNGQYGPNAGCDPSRNYPDPDSIVKRMDPKLYEQMTLLWPSYNGNNSDFHLHEWTKHGTCVTTLDPKCKGDKYVQYSEMLEYFRTTLHLNKRYDLYKALARKGIVPTNSRNYTVQAMLDAVKDKWGGGASVSCNKNGTLSEILLYFKVRGRDHYVPTVAYGNSSCKDPANVMYPVKTTPIH